MFKELIEAFRKSDRLGKMIHQVGDMLDAGQWMFQTACSVADKKTLPEDVREDLYARDQNINRLEYAIREGVVVHLATGHSQDSSMCLILMSVVKDAERIGDYCKNIFEIGQHFRSEYRRPEFHDELINARHTILAQFPRVRDAFLEGKQKLAAGAMDELLNVRKECDTMVHHLLAPDFPGSSDEAVAYALRARFLKRVASHLANIATSISNPVPMIDFHKGKPLDEPGR